jgi:hypothetical protein
MVRCQESIDAGDVGLDILLDRVGETCPCRAGGATETNGAEKSILRQCGRTEDFGEAAESDPALEFHLPQSILCVNVAQSEESIARCRCEDMWNGVGVADDLDRCGNAGHFDRSVHHRQ